MPVSEPKINVFVSVVVPIHNHAQLLESFVAETVAVLEKNFEYYELTLIDDDSRDETQKLIDPLLTRYEGVRYLRLSRHFGEEIAISAGLDTVIGDFVVVMSIESDPSDQIPAIVEESRKQHGIVLGVAENKAYGSVAHRWGASFFHNYLRRSLKIDVPQNTTQFICLPRIAVNSIIKIRDNFRYLRFISSYVGFEPRYFPYKQIHRSRRARKKPLGMLLNQGMAVLIQNSARPFRFITYLGLFAGFFNLAYIIYIFGVFFLKKDYAEGWVTLSLQNSTFYFFVFLMLSAISEYMGYMISEMKERPLYFVREEKKSSVLLVERNKKNVTGQSDGQ